MMEAVIGIIGVLLYGYVWWRIFEKTGGYSYMFIAMFVPGINVLAILWLAFDEWPLERRVRELEQTVEHLRAVKTQHSPAKEQTPANTADVPATSLRIMHELQQRRDEGQ